MGFVVGSEAVGRGIELREMHLTPMVDSLLVRGKSGLDYTAMKLKKRSQ